MLRKLLLPLALIGSLASPRLALAIEPDAPEQLVTKAEVIGILVRQKLSDAGAANGSAAPADHEALVTFYAARNGQPAWVSTTGLLPRATEAMAEIRRADDWGLRASAFDLPSSSVNGAEPDKLADAEIKLSNAVLKYARHARGGRFNPSDLTPDLDVRPQLQDPGSVMKAIAEAAAPANSLRRLHPKHPQFERLRQLLIAARAGSRPQRVARAEIPEPAVRGKPRGRKATRTDQVETEDLAPVAGPAEAANATKTKAILANMERWRYMPDELGRLHIWASVPDFEVRVVKDGKVIHQERMVVGKYDTQTSIFSAPMQEIVFQPYWHVPNSIKVQDIAPSLSKNLSILQRQNLGIRLNGRDIDPRSIDWSRADVRKYEFYQPPGGLNVLGVVKFAFPNKHDIYMHDTPSKNLFDKEVRDYSHGCMRVRNPRKLAEILLAEDKGWGAAQIAHQIAVGNDTHVALNRRIPVHVTYFTVWVDDDGKARYRDDLYGHDVRMIAALDGKPARAIAKDEMASLAARAAAKRPRAAERQPQQSAGGDAFFGWLMN